MQQWMGYPPLSYKRAGNNHLELLLVLWSGGGDLNQNHLGRFSEHVYKLCLPHPTRNESKIEEETAASMGICK